MAKTGVEMTIGTQLAEILDEYEHALDKEVQREIQSVAREAAARLQSTSPKKTGKYAGGWKARKGPNGAAVVYNSDAWQLTYLLEYGHALRNGVGSYGRVRAIPHIKPVEDWANTELTKRVENIIERGPR